MSIHILSNDSNIMQRYEDKQDNVSSINVLGVEQRDGSDLS